MHPPRIEWFAPDALLPLLFPRSLSPSSVWQSATCSLAPAQFDSNQDKMYADRFAKSWRFSGDDVEGGQQRRVHSTAFISVTAARGYFWSVCCPVAHAWHKKRHSGDWTFDLRAAGLSIHQLETTTANEPKRYWFLLLLLHRSIRTRSIWVFSSSAADCSWLSDNEGPVAGRHLNREIDQTNVFTFSFLFILVCFGFFFFLPLSHFALQM